MSDGWKQVHVANLMIAGGMLVPYMIWETWYAAYFGALGGYLLASESDLYWDAGAPKTAGKITGRILAVFGGLMLFLWLQGAARFNDLFPSEDSELGYLIVLMILIYVVVFGINRK